MGRGECARGGAVEQREDVGMYVDMGSHQDGVVLTGIL